MLLTTYSTDAYNTSEIETLADQFELETNLSDGILTVYFGENTPASQQFRDIFDDLIKQPWETA